MPNLDGVLEIATSDQTFSDRFKPGTIPNPPTKPTVPTNQNDVTPFAGAASGAFVLDFAVWSSNLRRGVLGTAPAAVDAGQIELAVNDEFFDDIYVLPRSIDFGIILAVQTETVDVFNAYRSGSVSWTGYDDSAAGAGVTLQNPAPPPPTIVLLPLQGSVHDLQVDPEGPPSFDANAVFDFLDPDSNMVERTMRIQGTRAALFPFEPEVPILETLQWRTRILKSRSGIEQRSGTRKTPRTIIKFDVQTKSTERQLLENLVSEGQARAFGVPLWYEQTELTTAIAINDTTINVTDTGAFNFRDGGLAVVWVDAFTFETLQIQSQTATTITFVSPFTKAFPIGSIVMPVSASLLLQKVDQQKHLNTLQVNTFNFTVIDNDLDLSDTSAFNSYTPPSTAENPSPVARVFLDDDNFVRGETIAQEFTRDLIIVDNQTSFPVVFTAEEFSREGSNRTFSTKSRTELENVRALLHALSGRRVAFYSPTFAKDFDLVNPLTAADTAIQVVDVKYSTLINGARPRDIVRIVLKDGTDSGPLLVTGSSSGAPGEETISFSPDTVGVTATIEEVERVEYVQKVRLDSDAVQIRHFDSAGKAVITFPIKAVLENDG